MTFDAIVDIVADDLNLTSAAAVARIGVHVNRRYRRITTRLGMNVFRRVETTLALTTGTSYQTVTGIERITGIFNIVDPLVRPTALDEITYDEMKEEILRDSDPTKWARVRMGASSTNFQVNSTVPDALSLLIEGEEVASTLSTTGVPAFSESFHDILVFGAKADEYFKMEKIVAARAMEADYERVLGELVLHATIGAYLDIVQNKPLRRTTRRRVVG